MEIILLTDIANLGHKDDIVDVTDVTTLSLKVTLF